MRRAGHLKEHGDPSSPELPGLGDVDRVVPVEHVELHFLFEAVARHISLNPFDLSMDRRSNGVVIAVALHQAVHGVAHQERRLSRVENNHGFAPTRTADNLERLRRRLGELVDVGAGARTS